MTQCTIRFPLSPKCFTGANVRYDLTAAGPSYRLLFDSVMDGAHGGTEAQAAR
jgi:hypothetical protein